MDDKKTNKWEGRELALLAFEAVMAVFYLIFAVVFLFPSLFPFQISTQFEGIRVVLGVILGVYGVFRIYRVIRKLF